jgi:glycerol-3-phosphate dehydrogenase
MKTDPSNILDIAIVGGGINGAALAFLAARSGLSVALFEKDDWAQGTSSRSTKLIHGGIRYLEQVRLSLVREALKDRRSLLADAPHLVRPLPFLLPVYEGDERPAWLLRIGLNIYDRLAGKKNLKPHEWLSPIDALLRAPGLKAEGLTGCGVYWDAQVNDARMVLENVIGARETGAYCVSGAEVIAASETPDGWQLTVRMPDGSSQNFSARSVADATGPWANKTSRFWSGKEEKKVRPTRGSHIIVPRVLTDYAVLVMAPKEKRILFVIPWRGCTLVGTTDVDDDGEPEKVRCTEEETEYLLHHASRLFPQLDWSKSQVLASFAGLRPLAWSDSKQASSVSREDKVSTQGRVVTIVGGKLTTYRSMARKALKQVFTLLGRTGDPPPETRLPGAPFDPWDSFLDRARREWPTAYGISEETALHLAQLYGNRAVPLLEPLRVRKDLAKLLYIGRPEIAAQVPYAIQWEDARHLDDILLRRLEIGFGPGRREAAEPASHLAAEILGWDEPTRAAEVKRYLDLIDPPLPTQPA